MAVHASQYYNSTGSVSQRAPAGLHANYAALLFAKAKIGPYRKSNRGWLPRFGLELIKWQKRKGTHKTE